jgi:hypothetical protein
LSKYSIIAEVSTTAERVENWCCLGGLGFGILGLEVGWSEKRRSE